MILLAPIIQIWLLARRSKSKKLKSTKMITLLIVILGIFLSFMATIVSMYGYSLAGIRCVTGCFSFVVLGCIISIIIVPIVGAIGYFIFYLKNRSKAKELV